MHVAGVATDSLTHLAALFQRTSQIAKEKARKRIAKARAEAVSYTHLTLPTRSEV